ncbi:MAG: signal recognition particle protein, partial [Acidimicrobiia bacterium]
IGGSRKRRIATGSGTTPTDVNRLLSQFADVQRVMKMMVGGRGLPGMPAGAQGLGMGNRGPRSTGPKSVNRKKKSKGRR